MDIVDIIMSRRSIRKYTSQPVDETILRRLLQAAMAASSAVNSRPKLNHHAPNTKRSASTGSATQERNRLPARCATP